MCSSTGKFGLKCSTGTILHIQKILAINGVQKLAFVLDWPIVCIVN